MGFADYYEKSRQKEIKDAQEKSHEMKSSLEKTLDDWNNLETSEKTVWSAIKLINATVKAIDSLNDSFSAVTDNWGVITQVGWLGLLQGKEVQPFGGYEGEYFPPVNVRLKNIFDGLEAVEDYINEISPEVFSAKIKEYGRFDTDHLKKSLSKIGSTYKRGREYYNKKLSKLNNQARKAGYTTMEDFTGVAGKDSGYDALKKQFLETLRQYDEYNQAKKAYKDLSKRHHPDKGGEDDAAKALFSAWDEIKKQNDWK